MKFQNPILGRALSGIRLAPGFFLKPLDKVVHHFLEKGSGNLAYFSCDCFLEFRSGFSFVLIHSIFEITSQIEVRGLKSGIWGLHSKSRLQLITRLPKCSLSQALATNDVLAGVFLDNTSRVCNLYPVGEQVEILFDHSPECCGDQTHCLAPFTK